MRIRYLSLAFLILFVTPVFAQDDGTLGRLKKDIFYLAGPECEGRGVETKGLDKAADYIAASLKASGVQPAGKDGSYFQPFAMTAFPEVIGKTSLAFTGPDEKTLTLKEKEDFQPTGYSSGGNLDAGIVYVGHGITAPNLKYDDYADVDVKGKWVIVIRRTPRPDVERDGRFDTVAAINGESPYNAIRLKFDNAVDHKAAGIIFVSDPVTADDADTLIPFNAHQYEDVSTRLPVVHMKRTAASRLLKEGLGKTLQELEAENDKTLKPNSAVLNGWAGQAEMGVERRAIEPKNIVGYLEGSGPLAEETVVVGAHYDHLGYGSGRLSAGGPNAQGKVHFGADDNGSGTTAVLELARRFGVMKNRRGRRIVFILFSGEERGLIGSKFYAEHPLFPLDKTVAMVNLDMVGRLRPGPGDWLGFTQKPQLQIWGSGTGDTFGRTIDAAENRYGLKVKRLPGGTGPSDHDSFYRKKIPVLFFFTDYHPQYHRPTDTPDTIDLPGLALIVNLTEDLLTDLSTALAPPKYIEVKEESTRPVAMPGVRLGVRPDYTYMGGDGMRIDGATPGSAAEKAGFKEGDVIDDIDGVPVRSVNGYMSALVGKKPGNTLEVTVIRGGKKMKLKITP